MRTLGEYARMTEAALKAQMDQTADAPALLRESMTYSLMAGGKRLRPSMLLASVEMLGKRAEDARVYACAVEMIHTYSLIHDDLPGMDNDVLRRGMPTSHVKFGEGQAILAGDGLLSLAFEIMTYDAAEHPEDAHRRIRAAYEIVHGAGAFGMVAGQCMDLLCEREKRGGRMELVQIQEGKTCRMFAHPMRAAGCLAGASEKEITALGEYGMAFGRMFQIEDDLLDVEGDAGTLGKSVGKDAADGKLTAVSVYGLDGARKEADRQLSAALDAADVFGDRGEWMKTLAMSMRGRRS